MGVRLTQTQWLAYVDSLAEQFQVHGPVVRAGRGAFSDTDVVGYGQISSSHSDLMRGLERMPVPAENARSSASADALPASALSLDRKSWFSPKEVVFPIRETLFRFLDGEAHVPELPETPVVLFLRPCDINGLERLDAIFLENGQERDFYYLRRRKRLKLVMIECKTGFENCFCVSMDANRTDVWDAAVRWSEDGALLTVRDEALMTGMLKELPQEPFEPEFIRDNREKVRLPALDDVTPEIFNHPLWTTYTDRCIACGRCNTSCVTCSCFTMQDVANSDDGALGERRRTWTGCHVDGFSDMAGGHAFRKKNGERMRFKTLHKINDFHRRFGKHMCVGCGRCSDVCPEYISFSTAINRLSEAVEEAKDHA